MTVNASPFSSRTYSKCIKLLHTAYGIAAETLQSEVHSEVRKAYEAPTDVPVVDISVSFDDSWLTREHISLIVIACVIDILTGYVIDFEVMCKAGFTASVHAENGGVNELLRHCCSFVLQRQSKSRIVTGGKVRAAKRLPRKSYTFSMGLRSGDRAGQTIRSISSLSKTCSAATVR
ncbi:uncharacterized protein TNCV_3004341 [Trichonephila clavipes]|nr:uncharacterized protein TNCV_3004341 [Trichonephila clavipes]